MSVKKCLTQREIEIFISECNDSESDQENAFILNKNTQMVYIPPQNVGEVTDEEDIDDGELMKETPGNSEVCGEIEVEYDSQVNDFAAPAQDLEIEIQVPSISKKYTQEVKFGVPKWRKSKRINFNFERPEESAVLPLQNKIVELMSKSMSNISMNR